MSCNSADRLKQSLLVHAPGSTEAIVNLELFNVLDNFFRRTNAWKWENQIQMSADYGEYALTPLAGSVVVRVLGVTHNDIAVAPVNQGSSTSSSSLGRLTADLTFSDGDAEFYPDVTDLAPVDDLFTYAIYRPDYITTSLNTQVENLQYPLKVFMSLSLHKDCLECDCGDWDIPEWMWDSYFDVFYNGTLGSLYGMPAKPWANPQLAVVHSKRYRNRQAFHKQEAERGFAYNAPAWRFPRGGSWV